MKYRLPAFTNQRTFAEAGALTSVQREFRRAGSRIASYVDKISRAPNLADLPVKQPTQV